MSFVSYDNVKNTDMSLPVSTTGVRVGPCLGATVINWYVSPLNLMERQGLDTNHKLQTIRFKEQALGSWLSMCVCVLG